MEIWLLLAVFIPLIGVVAVYIVSRFSDQGGTITTAIVCGLSFLATCMMYPYISSGKIIEYNARTGLPILVSFRADSLGLLLAIVASFLWFMASIYAIEYMRLKHAKTRYNIFSLFSFFGMMGIVLTGNLFTLYIFFEIMALLSYMLVIHEETEEAMRAGLKYLFMGIIGGLVLLIAIIATYVLTKTTSLSGAGLAGLTKSPFYVAIFWSFIFGFAIKAGMFPVHVWLPDAHPVAPAPASALLSGVMIKAGAYGIIRTIYAIYGVKMIANHMMLSNTVLLTLAIVSMMLGSLVAITQTEIKRLLAYSSVAQIGYVILGACMLSPRGLQGALLHIFNHALMKGTLFLCAGAIIYQTGLRKIEDLKGIGRRMPITMVCFTLAALSMIGFPPFVGFLSKWILAGGALDAWHEGVYSLTGTIIFISALLISALLNAVYYGPIIIRGWFGPGEEHGHGAKKAKTKSDDPSWFMLAPILILALGTLVFFIWPGIPLSLAKAAAKFYVSR